ncbi:peroxide stress protein YaaA [Gammaproteobacteria bacterium]|nr:peroxide stress protein YaaA [Gammaproteobacteria bacterium]
MFVLISPAKKQDFNAGTDGYQAGVSIPFASKTEALLGILKQYSEGELAQALSVSHQLAQLNHQRFATFDLSGDTKSALFAYQGDVYQYMGPDSWNEQALINAKQRLFIVSAMYGILRADTKIAPYRLEMINRIGHIGPMAKYWSEEVTAHMNDAIQGGILLNLASKAYSEVINRKKFQGQIIDINFLDQRPDGQLKTVAVNAKRARGLMAKAVMQMSDPSIDAVKSLAVRDYQFDETLSSDHIWVFVKH